RIVWRPGGGVRSLPRGDAELLAGAVPVLRRRRVAADGQRPGAVLRVVPLPRAAVQRAEGGLSRDSGPRVGPSGGGGRDPAAPGLRRCGGAGLVPADVTAWGTCAGRWGATRRRGGWAGGSNGTCGPTSCFLVHGRRAFGLLWMPHMRLHRSVGVHITLYRARL